MRITRTINVYMSILITLLLGFMSVLSLPQRVVAADEEMPRILSSDLNVLKLENKTVITLDFEIYSTTPVTHISSALQNPLGEYVYGGGGGIEAEEI